ncbi:MAG: MJ1255/VC2487 family glycosyltransferase [Candidatus Pacearchaeota archaeon]
MRILYGVAGVGFGHSSRALLIGKYLEEKGHKVKILTYGDGYKVLKNKFDCFKVRGLSLIFNRGILRKRKTIKYNLENFPKNALRWKKFHRLIKEFKPDLCISDMEPIVPILRNLYNLPLISIDNQHRLTNLEINIPEKYKKDFLIAKNVVNSFVRRADKFIVSSFSNSRIIKGNTVIVPPIIRKEIRELKPRYGNKVLVYLSKSDKKVLRVLEKFNEEFIVYGFNIKDKKGNIEFKTRESFLKDLESCKCIIGTAGFSLIGEAIYLNKPYLAIPLKGQFEQVLNALFLKKASFGDYSEELKEKEIKDFLGNLDNYKKKLRQYNPDYNKLFKVLDKALTTIHK